MSAFRVTAVFGTQDATEDWIGFVGCVLLGILGVYRLGQNVHIFLLVGLMLLLLGFLKAREAAGRAP